MKAKSIQNVVLNAASVNWLGLPGWPAMKLRRWLAGLSMGPMAAKPGLGMRQVCAARQTGMRRFQAPKMISKLATPSARR